MTFPNATTHGDDTGWLFAFIQYVLLYGPFLQWRYFQNGNFTRATRCGTFIWHHIQIFAKKACCLSIPNFFLDESMCCVCNCYGRVITCLCPPANYFFHQQLQLPFIATMAQIHLKMTTARFMRQHFIPTDPESGSLLTLPPPNLYYKNCVFHRDRDPHQAVEPIFSALKEFKPRLAQGACHSGLAHIYVQINFKFFHAGIDLQELRIG